VGAALLISPAIGFGLAAVLLLVARRLIPSPELYEPPRDDRPPPWWIRLLLIGTCTGVSFAHGSNDGQKGMGLIMLVLIGIVPASFALDMRAGSAEITAAREAATKLETELSDPVLTAMMDALKERHVANTRVEQIARSSGVAAAAVLESPLVDDVLDPFPRNDALLATLDPLPLAREVRESLDGTTSFADLHADDRWQLRTRLVELGLSVRILLSEFGDRLAADRRAVLASLAGDLSRPVEYVPEWVVMGVALCLGLGTMVGWKRIVVTVGEKIGKTHLTYAQGGAAELVAAATIAMADSFGMPVSTTHVLSSGVAGTMWANGSGIQPQTVREIALAWILTLPVVMLLAGGLYWLATWFVA
jgi:PiT family inorganic phosphate transporter